MKHVAILRLMV